VTLQGFYNDSKEGTLKLCFEHSSNEGFDVVYDLAGSEGQNELMIPREGCKVILYKLNPKTQHYKSGHKL
jgi:hypothetical protein